MMMVLRMEMMVLFMMIMMVVISGAANSELHQELGGATVHLVEPLPRYHPIHPHCNRHQDNHRHDDDIHCHEDDDHHQAA